MSTATGLRESVIDAEGLSGHNEEQAVGEHLAYIEKLNEFYQQMERCYVLAHTRNDVDLFHYFESLYEKERDTDSMYVTVSELSYLIAGANKMNLSRARSSIIPPDEDAEKLVELFHDLHDVEMMGHVRRHVPPYEKFLAHQREAFSATKVNSHGLRQRRWLWIDTETMMLYNFDQNLRLKKRLPLVQLVQVEAPQAFPRMLTLVFSSAGVDQALLDDDVMDNLETTYRLDFRSKVDSDRFCKMLLDLCESITRFEDIILQEEEQYYDDDEEEEDEEEEGGGGPDGSNAAPVQGVPVAMGMGTGAHPHTPSKAAKRRASMLIGGTMGLATAVRLKGFASRARGRASMVPKQGGAMLGSGPSGGPTDDAAAKGGPGVKWTPPGSPGRGGGDSGTTSGRGSGASVPNPLQRLGGGKVRVRNRRGSDHESREARMVAASSPRYSRPSVVAEGEEEDSDEGGGGGFFAGHDSSDEEAGSVGEQVGSDSDGGGAPSSGAEDESPEGNYDEATVRAAEAAARAGQYEWRRIGPDEEGDVFFVHLLTGASQWEVPPGWAAHKAYVKVHGKGTGTVPAAFEEEEDEVVEGGSSGDDIYDKAGGDSDGMDFFA